MSRYPWLWPVILVISATTVGLFALGDISTPLRAPVALWFLIVCPGMAFVPFLRLREWLVESVLAIAMSLALDALVAGTMLYAGIWSPNMALVVLIDITLVGVLLQVLRPSPELVRPRIATADGVSISAGEQPISVGGVVLPEGLFHARDAGGDGIKPVVVLVGLLNDWARTGYRIVGWFYAAPGSVANTPWKQVAGAAQQNEAGTDLLLLLDPATQQGTLHTWQDGRFVPASVYSMPQMSGLALAEE